MAFFSSLLARLFSRKAPALDELAAPQIPVSAQRKNVSGVSKTGQKISSSQRARAAIAAAVALAASTIGYQALKTPEAVLLATNSLIKPWEGLVLKSHWDPYAKIWDICYGETKNIKAGMTKTRAECDSMLEKRVYWDYYMPLVKQIPGFTKFPVSVQAVQISGAYNFGLNGMVNSTAVKLARQGRFKEACEAQTSWNKAGGHMVTGLVRRREMGDAQRIGEAELCLSGL